MGWSARQYYTSSPYEFHAACEGYFDKRLVEESWQRRSTEIVYKVMGGKQNFNKMWKLETGQQETPVIPMTPERRQAILDRYNKNK